MKTIRKGAIVECIGGSKEKMKVWGTRFKVYHKVQLINVNKKMKKY